jgi:hypothetical protein
MDPVHGGLDDVLPLSVGRGEFRCRFLDGASGGASFPTWCVEGRRSVAGVVVAGADVVAMAGHGTFGWSCPVLVDT